MCGAVFEKRSVQMKNCPFFMGNKNCARPTCYKERIADGKLLGSKISRKMVACESSILKCVF